jgi:hypothetical protein
MKLEKAIRRIIPSTPRLTYNPIFKMIVDSFDLLPKLMFKELSAIPPNHMRIRVGVGNRFLANHILFMNMAKNFWMRVFYMGLCRLDSNIVDIGCGCGRFDLTGIFCTSGSERKFTLEGRWYADETVQAGADRELAAAN